MTAINTSTVAVKRRERSTVTSLSPLQKNINEDGKREGALF